MKTKRGSALFRDAGLLALAFCLAMAAVAEGEPFKVQWPEGWEVKRFPGPTIPGGKIFVGEIQARRLDEHGLAVLHLTYFPRQEGSKADLEGDLDTMIRGQTERLQSLGITVTVTSRKAGSLGAHPSREAEIFATGQGYSARFWLAAAVSREYIYSFSYTGFGDAFEKHRGAFEATLSSLVLQ